MYVEQQWGARQIVLDDVLGLVCLSDGREHLDTSVVDHACRVSVQRFAYSLDLGDEFIGQDFGAQEAQPLVVRRQADSRISGEVDLVLGKTPDELAGD